jgi:hypothetical protein
MARVCKKWRVIAYDTRLWRDVSLRPEISGLHVGSLESLLGLIRLAECYITFLFINSVCQLLLTQL